MNPLPDNKFGHELAGGDLGHAIQESLQVLNLATKHLSACGTTSFDTVGLQEEGNLWRALGILIAAGALKTAVLVLREDRMPEAALAFMEAAWAAGFGSPSTNSEIGGSLPLAALPSSSLSREC